MKKKNLRKLNKICSAFLVFTMVSSWAYGLIPNLEKFSPEVKRAEATGSPWQIRQEINIIDGYMSAAASTYATSSAIVNLDITKYSGDKTYYFEVVASTTAGIAGDVYLKSTSGVTYATATYDSSATVPKLIRSSSFTPPASATNLVAVIDNEAGATKSIKSARIVILQNFPDTAESAATSTQTQIEIGSATTSASNTSSLPLQYPKYWAYDADKWDGALTVYAEATYQNTQTSSTTSYTTDGTYTYIVSPGTSYTQVEAWGAGGGGGGAASGGGGGGGGAYARSTTTNGVGTSHTLVVGNGGTRETDGGDTTYDTTTVIAEGGLGANNATGGAGGNTTVSVGTVEEPGGTGGNADTSPDTGGGGGGSGGPSGSGSNGQVGQASVGGAGGTANCECSNTYQSPTNGGNGGNGSAGTSAVTGGNGGGGSDTSATTGGPGGAPGGGAGGADSTSATATGADGQIKLTETHGAVGIAIEEDNGAFGSWTFKKQITTGDVSTSTSERVRSASFTPVDGRHYRIVASSTNASAPYSIYNAKIVVDQNSGIPNATYLQEFSVAAKEITPTDVFFRADGLKMYTIGVNDLVVDEYDLGAAWDVTTAVYLREFGVDAKEFIPQGLFFRDDGLKMYTIGSDGDTVDEYDLGTAWNVTTAVYLREFSVAAKELTPSDIFFSADGLKMYTIGYDGDTVDEYDLGTAWNVTTAVYLQEFSVAAKEINPRDVFFSADGLKMYTIGFDGDTVDEYDLGTAWNVTTAVYLQEFSVAAKETDPAGVFFRADGLKMYTTGSNGDTVDEYDLVPFITKLEPQYLLANARLASGTGLQGFLTEWDSAEWSGVSNVYLHAVDAADNSTSDVTLQQADGGGTLTDSAVNNPDNHATSTPATGFTMPSSENLDIIANANNGDVYGSRILVQTTQYIATTIGGTVYSSEGGGTIADGTTIQLYKNGSTLVGSDTTVSGVYSISDGIISGDILTAYIDGHATDGVTVLVSDGTTKSDVHIYGSVLAVRDDVDGTITNANLTTAIVGADTGDMLHTTDGSNNLTVASNAELHVWTGDTFTPGATVTTQGTGDLHLDDSSTATLGSATNVIADDIIVDTGVTLNINANTNVNGGSIITSGTGTVTYTGTPLLTISGTGTLGGGSGAFVFYDLTIASGANITGGIDILLSDDLVVESLGSLVLSAESLTLASAGASITNDGTLTFNDLSVLLTPSTQPSTSFSIGGALSVSSSRTLAPTAGTITMTGGSISNSGTLTFYNLDIAGTVTTSSTFGVANNMTSTSGTLTTSGGVITVTGDLSVAGTITGTGDIIVNGGDVTGNGTLNLTSGTFLVDGTGIFGGDTGWSFNKLTLGDGSGTETKTSSGTGSITTATTTVTTSQTLYAGAKTWTLTASHEPFQLQGYLNAETSTFRYTGSSNATVTPATYYNLELSPSSGSPTYKLGTTTGQTITVENNLTLAGSGNVTFDVNTRDPILDINGSLTIGDGDTFSASDTAMCTIAGNYSDNNSSSSGFDHGQGTITLDSTNTATISSVRPMVFNNLNITTPGKHVKFQKHTAEVPVFTFDNIFTVTGAVNNLIYIESDIPGSQWLVEFLNTQSDISFVSVRDSACVVGSFSVTYNGNNSGGGNNGSCWNIGNVGADGSQTVTSTEQGSGGGTLRTGGGQSGAGGGSEGGSGGGQSQGGGGQGGGGGGTP